MPRVTKNAFKGYGYQFCVAILFSFFLEFYSNDFNEIECEAFKKSEHNFDDIKIKTTNGNYFVQVKNCSGANNEVKIENGCATYCGTKSKLINGYTNIFVCNSPFPLDLMINTSFYGIPAIKYYDSNALVIYLTIDAIYDFIAKNCINSKRMDDLTIFFADKLIKTTKIHNSEIPEFVLYSNDLIEKTYMIRDMNKSSFTDNVVFIVAPPGFGKSHLVNELNIEKHHTYRFWVSNDDYAYSDRLQYNNFIMFISNVLFTENRSRSEDDLIEAISKLDDWFVLDGLDHVFNYAPLEFEKYKSFIKKCSIKKGIKLMVMTRPLLDSFYKQYKTIDLKPWSEEECRTYCVYEGIESVLDQNKIYGITDGYPIITHYLCEEYKHNGGVVRNLDKMRSVEDYYQDLLSTRRSFDSTIKQLGSFCALSPFVHIDDIPYLFGKAMLSTFKGIAEDYPQLIIFKNERFYFYHDSLYRFVKDRCKFEYLDDMYDKITCSLLDGDVRFMARAPLYDIKKEKLKQIIVRYSDFDFFISLFKNTFDVESIKAFYNKITVCLSDMKDVLNIYQTYSMIIILLLISRNYYEDNKNLSIQIYEHLKMAKIDWKHLVFSNGYLNKNLSYIDENGLHIEKNTEVYLTSFEGDDSLERGYKDESSYFNIIKRNLCKPIEKYLLENNRYIDSYIFCEYLVSGYIHGDKYCKESVDEFVKRPNQNYGFFYDAKQHFKFITKDTSEFQVRYAYRLAVSRLNCLGFLPGVRDYGSIEEFLDNNKTLNTFDMCVMLNGFIRFSTRAKKKLNLNQMYPYLLMMDAHKDITIYYLPEAMAFYVNHGLLTLTECCKWVDKAHLLIDDGNRGFATTFVSYLNKEHVKTLLDTGYFSRNHRYYIFVEDLPKEVINKLPYEIVFNRVTEIFRTGLYGIREFEQEKLGNILSSKHMKQIKIYLSLNGIILKRSKKEKSKKENKEQLTYAQLKYGYYREECKDDYIKYGFTAEDMAKLRTGYGFKLCDLTVFDIFPRETIAKNIKRIIDCAIFNNDDYNQYFQYCSSLIYKIPEMYEIYGVHFDNKKGGIILKKYIKAILRI